MLNLVYNAKNGWLSTAHVFRQWFSLVLDAGPRNRHGSSPVFWLVHNIDGICCSQYDDTSTNRHVLFEDVGKKPSRTVSSSCSFLNFAIFEVCSIFEHTHLVLENTRGIERIALENPQQEHSVAAHARRGEIQSVWLKLGYHSPTKREWWQPLRIRNVYQKMSKFETYWGLQSWVMFWGSTTRILQVSWQLFTIFYQSFSCGGNSILILRSDARFFVPKQLNGQQSCLAFGELIPVLSG